MFLLKRAYYVFKERGFIYVVKLAWPILLNFIKNITVYPLMEKKYTRILEGITIQDRLFLWTVKFGWNVPLFQRPQHIARCFAKNGNTVFYYSDPTYDTEVNDIKEIFPNLYLVNSNNKTLIRALEKYLKGISKKKYFHLYSTNWEVTLEALKNYEKMGYHILYEYIDDLAPEISGTKEIPKSIQDKFDYVISDDHIPMTVTADLLREQVIESRGEKNLAFSTNGVDVDHFRVIDESFIYNEKFQKVLKRNKKIVGYYGAVAKWFDYDLLKYAAEKLPDVDFVLIGKLYDESYNESGIEAVPNIHFIGPVPYDDIPQYAAKFDICTIPFLVNSITNATSPLKLFEYMALEKPILTTAMLESSKYASVNTSSDFDDYVQKVKLLLNYTPENNPAYYEVLRKEADENRWERKTEIILEMLEKYETENV